MSPVLSEKSLWNCRFYFPKWSHSHALICSESEDKKDLFRSLFFVQGSAVLRGQQHFYCIFSAKASLMWTDVVIRCVTTSGSSVTMHLSHSLDFDRCCNYRRSEFGEKNRTKNDSWLESNTSLTCMSECTSRILPCTFRKQTSSTGIGLLFKHISTAFYSGLEKASSFSHHSVHIGIVATLGQKQASIDLVKVLWCGGLVNLLQVCLQGRLGSVLWMSFTHGSHSLFQHLWTYCVCRKRTFSHLTQ